MFFICIYYFTIGHTSLIHNVPCLRSPITIISSFFVQHWQGNCSCVAKEKWWWWSFFALCLFFIIIALPTTIIHFLHFIKWHCPSNPSTLSSADRDQWLGNLRVVNTNSHRFIIIFDFYFCDGKKDFLSFINIIIYNAKSNPSKIQCNCSIHNYRERDGVEEGPWTRSTRLSRPLIFVLWNPFRP